MLRDIDVYGEEICLDVFIEWFIKVRQGFIFGLFVSQLMSIYIMIGIPFHIIVLLHRC